MNSNATPHSGTAPSECQIYTFMGGKPDQTTTEAYAVLVFIIILSIVTCPLTTVLNALVIIAVKTKPRLKTMSNIILGCSAVTDGLMGLIGLPVVIAARIATLLAETTSDFCALQDASRNVIRTLVAATVFHLVIMNSERYVAMKHSLQYMNMVTKHRVLGFSALAWITAFFITIPLAITANDAYLIVTNIVLFTCVMIISYCQVVIYNETRRHEKQIAAQQVSVETRQKFLKEKKVFKVTAIVLLTLLSTYSPILVVRIFLRNSVIKSKNVAFLSFFFASFVVKLNSLVNPLIYCIRTRQFRVAFIAILLKKSNAQAEKFEMRAFASTNNNNNDNNNNNNNDNNNNDDDDDNRDSSNDNNLNNNNNNHDIN